MVGYRKDNGQYHSVLSFLYYMKAFFHNKGNCNMVPVAAYSFPAAGKIAKNFAIM